MTEHFSLEVLLLGILDGVWVCQFKESPLYDYQIEKKIPQDYVNDQERDFFKRKCN